MIVLGGFPQVNKTFFLNLKTFTWESINVKYKRSKHTANLYGKDIILFGGTYHRENYIGYDKRNYGTPKNHVHLFDTSTFTKKKVQTWG